MDGVFLGMANVSPFEIVGTKVARAIYRPRSKHRCCVILKQGYHPPKRFMEIN
jgi:hypothetical protein